MTSPSGRSKVTTMIRGAVLFSITCAVILHGASARCESSDAVQLLTTELDLLESSGASRVASAEMERARDLLRMASNARRDGQGASARAILAILPLQIRLIRELLQASRDELEANELETRLLSRQRDRQVERERLEATLERLLALSVVWDEGR